MAPPLFIPHLRTTLKRIKDDPYPSVTVFHNNQPRYYRKEVPTGQWVRFHYKEEQQSTASGVSPAAAAVAVAAAAAVANHHHHQPPSHPPPGRATNAFFSVCPLFTGAQINDPSLWTIYYSLSFLPGDQTCPSVSAAAPHTNMMAAAAAASWSHLHSTPQSYY